MLSLAYGQKWASFAAIAHPFAAPASDKWWDPREYGGNVVWTLPQLSDAIRPWATAPSSQPVGVEVYNAGVPDNSRWSSLGDATNAWEYLLRSYSRRIWATVGDDFSRPVSTAVGRTSVMVLGVTSGMPETGNVAAWRAKGSAITDKLRLGQFYICVGNPIRFTSMYFKNGMIVAETAEPATIQFVTDLGVRKTLTNATMGAYSPSGHDNFVIVKTSDPAARAGRWSMSQAFWVDRIQSSKGVVGKVSPYSAALALVSEAADSAGDPLVLASLEATLTVPDQSSETMVELTSLAGDDVPPAPQTGLMSSAFEVTSTPASLTGATLSVTADSTAVSLYGLTNLRLARYDPGSGWDLLQSATSAEITTVAATIPGPGIYALTHTELSDTSAPVVSILAPPTDATLSGQQTLTAAASDDTGVWRVSFFLDDLYLGEDADGSDGFSADADLSAYTSGLHQLRAVAEDVSGNRGETASVVTLDTSVPKPAAAIDSPSDGSSVDDTISVQGTASSTVTRVDVSVDEALVGSVVPDSGAFRVEGGHWSSGEHTITVTAYDDATNHSSTTVKVSGPAPDTTNPTIGAVHAPTSVTVNTTATVSADVMDDRAVASALLFYRVRGSSDAFRLAGMTPGGSGHEQASISPWDVTLAGIEYYVWAADADGNEVVSPANAPGAVFTIQVTPIATKTVLKASTTTPSYGYASVLTVTVTDAGGRPISGRQVSIDYRTAGASKWSTLVTPATSSNGVASVSVRPSVKTTYVAKTAARGDHANSQSGSVIVTPKVYLTSAKASRLGYRYYRLCGTIKPAHSSSKAVRIYRWRYVSGKWRSYSYVYSPASSYTYSMKYKFPYAGKWRVQVVHPADSYNAYNKTGYTVFYVK